MSLDSDRKSSMILIISGPAGSGKTTLCERLAEHHPSSIVRMVTTTSRAPRPGEQDGVDYHFLSPEEFEQHIQEGAFMEWARVHGQYYGSQRRHIESVLDSSRDILLNIDVQGAATFQEKAREDPFLSGRILMVFIKPENQAQLHQRLTARATDSEQEINRRLQNAAREIEYASRFDTVIVSRDREHDFQILDSVYGKAKSNLNEGFPVAKNISREFH